MEKLTQQNALVENRVFYQRETCNLGTSLYNSFEVILNPDFKFCTGVFFVTGQGAVIGVKKNNVPVIANMPRNASHIQVKSVPFDKWFIPVQTIAQGEKIHVFFDKRYSTSSTLDVIFRLEQKTKDSAKIIKWDFDTIEGLTGGVDKTVKLNINNLVKRVTGFYVSSNNNGVFSSADITLRSYSTVYFNKINTNMLPNITQDSILGRFTPVLINSKDIWIDFTNVLGGGPAGVHFMYTYE